MRPVDKKQLREIVFAISDLVEKLQELCDNHQEWMEEREDEVDNWDDTPTGRRASDEQYYFDDWKDSIESIQSDMEELI